MPEKIKAIVIGTGGFAGWMIQNIYKAEASTTLTGLIEPSLAAREKTAAMILEKCQRECPPYFDSLEELTAKAGRPDVAYVITPHKFHLAWIESCLTAGIDVLVEKPMVLSTEEALRTIEMRDRTGRLLVVGFPGSLSPAMTKAKRLIAEGAIGPVQGVAAIVHQGWLRATTGTWRQNPEISGGGFLFDTGSHAINTVVDLIGQDLAEIHAVLDPCGSPVEINSTINGVFTNGIKLAVLGIGNSFDCRGDIRVIGQDGVIEIGMWGHYLNLFTPQTKGKYRKVPYGKAKSTWDNFVDVYQGKKPNPCPAEVGLRFAKLMDMIRRSAATGQVVKA